MKICFAASAGGHFEQLMMLKPMMERYDSFVVTEKTKYDIAPLNIPTYKIHLCNRKELLFLPKIFSNTIKSVELMIKEKPDVIICTGVLSMIPLCLFGKLMKKKLIYVESFAKVTSPTMTGKFLYKFADRFYVQWESMLIVFPKAVYRGAIY